MNRYIPILIVSALTLLYGCGKGTEETKLFDPVSGKHIPSDWKTNHGSSYTGNQSLCKSCHGGDLKGGQSGVSCDSCHSAPHIHPFTGHYNAAVNGCTACHGNSYQGGVKAPSCSSCHKNLLSGLTPQKGSCVSCHGKASGPDGAAFPNRSGSHRKHLLLAGVDCGLCHSGGGTGTDGHGTRSSAVVNFDASLASPSASFSSAAGTCANVRCHGGETTPSWLGGKLNPQTECSKCHAFKGGFIGYSSGMHNKHIFDISLTCKDCHDTAKMFVSSGSSHFSNLLSPAFELSPASTLRDALNYNSGSCTPTPGSFSINQCHSAENWR